MKLPANIHNVLIEAEPFGSTLALFSYLSWHVRNGRVAASSEIEVGKEPLVTSPRVWDGSLTGTSGRLSTLGYAGAATGDIFLDTLTLDGWTLPVDPLISVSAAKTVVQTQMTGGVGPVVEEVALEGYTIVIRGVLINEDNDDYPFDQVAKLNNLFTKMGGIKVQNDILNRCYGIDKIVIKSHSEPAEAGAQSMQVFTITAVSDRDVQLEIKEGWS